MITRPERLSLGVACCLSLLVVAIVAGPTQAEILTLGHDLVDRPNSNTGNYMHAFVAPVSAPFPATLTEWASYDNDDAGKYMTPLIMEDMNAASDRFDFTIRGVGTPRQSDGTGVQGWFPFGVVDGSDQFLNEDYYFGWYDGNATTGIPTEGVPDWEYGGPGQIITVARNVGVVSAGDFFADPFPTTQPASRTYSVQFKLDQVPEPSSVAMLCSLVLVAIGIGWRRRRKA